MKLFKLHEDSAYDSFREKMIYKIQHKIYNGDSKLKILLSNTDYNISHVVKAIINGNCMNNPIPGEKALGPSYLEQIISTTLRELFFDDQISLGDISRARKEIFNLPVLSDKEIKNLANEYKLNRYQTIG